MSVSIWPSIALMLICWGRLSEVLIFSTTGKSEAKRWMPGKSSQMSSFLFTMPLAFFFSCFRSVMLVRSGRKASCFMGCQREK